MWTVLVIQDIHVIFKLNFDCVNFKLKMSTFALLEIQIYKIYQILKYEKMSK